jgi:hypothetical protein
MNDICHIIMPHHVLNDYCPQQRVRNDFRGINHLPLMIGILVVNSIVYLKIFTRFANYLLGGLLTTMF